MSRPSAGRPAADARGVLHANLLDRRGEIEEAVATRVYAISRPSEVADPEYLAGLRSALTASLDYAFVALELGEEREPPPPPALLAQARLAARNGVGLDTVLRRYFAGHGLLEEIIVEEAERVGLRGEQLRHLLRGQSTLFDRLLAAISEEHRRESSTRGFSSEARRARRIERLLSGEAIETATLSYNFDAHHLGLVGTGADAEGTIRGLAASLDRSLLLVKREEMTVWAWLGGQDAVSVDRVLSGVPLESGVELTLGLGEPAEGLAGWRLTHRQAAASIPIAPHNGQRVVRYADVALLASSLQDDLLTASLHHLYLAPLQTGRDRGESLRATLQAYFAAGRNVSSAAATLGINRNTVTSRLRAVELNIGGPLDSHAAELEAALRIQRFEEQRQSRAECQVNR